MEQIFSKDLTAKIWKQTGGPEKYIRLQWQKTGCDACVLVLCDKKGVLLKISIFAYFQYLRIHDLISFHWWLKVSKLQCLHLSVYGWTLIIPWGNPMYHPWPLKMILASIRFCDQSVSYYNGVRKNNVDIGLMLFGFETTLWKSVTSVIFIFLIYKATDLILWPSFSGNKTFLRSFKMVL
jgi:hypothetical protein